MNLDEFKTDLLESIITNPSDAIKKLKNNLSPESDTFDDLIILGSQYNIAKRKESLNTTSQEDINITINRVIKGLISMVKGLNILDIQNAIDDLETRAINWEKGLNWLVDKSSILLDRVSSRMQYNGSYFDREELEQIVQWIIIYMDDLPDQDYDRWLMQQIQKKNFASTNTSSLVKSIDYLSKEIITRSIEDDMPPKAVAYKFKEFLADTKACF